MPNSAGVVGPDYLTPIDLGFGAATLTNVAQAVVDLGLVVDSTATITTANVNPSVDYLPRVSADLSGVIAAATLITALESAGVLDDGGGVANVVGPDYLAPQDPPTTDLAGILAALASGGYLNDTD